MAKNNEALSNSDLSDFTKRMRDSTVEYDAEDYIQPSQPLSLQGPSPEYMRKKSQSINDKKEISISTIDETFSFPKSIMSTPLGDASRDFIPESENPVTRKIHFSEQDEGCKKRLNLDESSLIKETPDMFSTQSQMNDTIDASHLKVAAIPGELDLENVSLVPESPPRINETLESQQSYTMFSESEKRCLLGETTVEDSLDEESANFYVSGTAKIDISQSREEEMINRTAENTPGEIITIDSSKFMNDSGMESLLRSEKAPLVAEVKKKIDSREAQLDDTVDAEDIECYEPYSREKTNDSEQMKGGSVQPVTEELTSSMERRSTSTPTDSKPEVSGLKGVLKNVSDEELARLQKHSTPENPLSKSPKINESTSSIENGTPPVQDAPLKSSEINFTIYLQMDCQLVMDPQIGEPISKRIINVKELLKRQPKQFFLEPNSDSSYKTKRLSSSSSGSVYSDKTGLPYALPSRSLPVSVNSSSSSVDLAKHIKIVERQVWVNEYKIPMTMDEIIPRYIENHKMDLQTNNGKPMTKRKVSIRLRKRNDLSHPLDNVLESSMTEQSSGNNSDDLLPSSDKTSASKPKENSADEVNNCLDHKLTNNEVEKGGKEIVTEVENALQKNICQSPNRNEFVDGIVSQGLLVFARWTDKRYYPGIVESKAKYDRWEVKFDDDTEKVIREELILPLNWLTKGELVFALTADKYMSGKITDIIRDEEIKFKIELDDTNEEIVVRKCDICLNDVMAGIIREKFKPSNKLIPPLKSSDIDVDNVVTGKRVREQRTPIRSATSVLQSESSTARKRKGGLSLSDSGAGDKGETPLKKRTPFHKREINSEKKTRSSLKREAKPELPSQSVRPIAEVPSTAGETPVRMDSKLDVRKKRARTLKYDSVGPEFSIRKLRKSESVTIDEAQGTTESQKASTTVNTEIGDGSGIVTNSENTEKRKKERAKKQKQVTLKKLSKNEKGKSEKVADRMSTRSGKGKKFTTVQELTMKKKNLRIPLE